eukprot:TRINITY_DN21125_c0_g1_i1.p1 TRINITY_DN21125_c0_g1~~TRINITY_DN21125_c0_g1_i1.p1  ORF type:complete len:164 (-),score=18.02 TRINITY_DN21125_c0_g1_i1:60-551(-)
MLLHSIECGFVSILRYLYETYHYTSVEFMSHAASHGNVDCIAYLHDVVGMEWTTTTCANAACNKKGDTKCLQYLHERGCEWDSNTIVCAAYYSNLECMIYAHQNGCPVPEKFQTVGPKCIDYIDSAIYPGYSQKLVVACGMYCLVEDDDDNDGTEDDDEGPVQ